MPTLNQFLTKRVVLKELKKLKPRNEKKTSLRAIVQRVLTVMDETKKT